MSQNEAVRGHERSHEGARAYRGRPGAGPASEMAPCIENSTLCTLLCSQIEQQRRMTNLADTIQVRTRQPGIMKGRTRAPAHTRGGPACGNSILLGRRSGWRKWRYIPENIQVPKYT
jgi:hypothetical protein